jgi:hypothetical protein
VEEVLASRLFGKLKSLEYQLSCKGCDLDDIWYLARNLKNSSTLLETFHENYPNASGPPLRLAHWIRVVVAGEYDDDHPDNNKAAHSALGIGKRYTTRHN